MPFSLGINAAKVPDNAPDVNTIISATVKGYLPDRNLYYVKLKYNVPGATEYEYASGPVSVTGPGAAAVPVYSAGETVYVVMDKNAGYSNEYRYVIIGRAPELQTPEDAPVWSILPNLPSMKSIWDGAQNLYSSIRQHLPWAVTNADKLHTAPMHLFPGDHYTGSLEGPFALAGKHIYMEGIKDACYTVYDDVFNRKQDTVHEKFLDTPCVSDHITLAGNDHFRESYTSIDIQEGAGFCGEEPTDNDQYFMVPRTVRLEGTFIDGTYDAITIPAKAGSNEEQDSIQAIPVAYTYDSYAGAHTKGSASEITLQKSFLMDLPHRQGATTSFSDPIYAPADDEEPYVPDEETLSVSSLLYEQTAGIVSPVGVDANQDTWYMQTPGDIEQAEQVMEPSYKASGTETYDPLPEVINITDPKTGKQYTYYASNSFIKMLPDGSIVIADGYGSEIRMYRGNIYISPKNDLVTVSGRDTMMMSGRTTAIKGYKRVQINSTTSDVYIKAEEHMRLLSGVSGTGYLTVENRVQDPTKGGLILRGNHSVGITAQNIYMGLTTGKDVTEGQLDTQATGSIVVNAGRGSVSINGTAVHATGSDVTLAGYNNVSGMGSVFSLQATQAVLNCSTAVVSTMGLAFGPVDTPLSIQGISYNGELITITGFSAQGNSDMIQIDGHVQLTGSVIANGQIVSNTGMYSRQGGFVNANPEYSGLAIRDEGFNNIAIETASVIAPVNLDSSWTTHINGVAQSNILTGERFIYPSSQELGINPSMYNIPGMRWQAFSEGTSKWKEKAVKDPIDGTTSMVYPGEDAWTNGTITVGTDEGDHNRDLVDNFIISVKED